MAWRAIRFCGDEIGELWPPILAASAIAIYDAMISIFDSGY